MNSEPDAFDLVELSGRAGVSQRTVRYYIQQGLLPSPETRGPGAHYGPEHLDRLRLIRTLQREHLPLAEIRKRLEQLSPEAVRALVDAERPVGDARDYIRSVLSEGAPMMTPHRLREAAPASAMEHPDLFAKEKQRKAMLVRAQWDRIPLSADVELHVRRPLSREQNKQVERLLQAARHIFEEE